MFAQVVCSGVGTSASWSIFSTNHVPGFDINLAAIQICFAYEWLHTDPYTRVVNGDIVITAHVNTLIM